MQFAREQQVPFLGICLGMQLAVIEFARNILGLKEAHSTEFNEDTQYPIIAMIEEWHDQKGTIEHRDQDSDLGGTMRLGEQVCNVQKESTAYAAYQKELIIELKNRVFLKEKLLFLVLQSQALEGHTIDHLKPQLLD